MSSTCGTVWNNLLRASLPQWGAWIPLAGLRPQGLIPVDSSFDSLLENTRSCAKRPSRLPSRFSPTLPLPALLLAALAMRGYQRALPR